MARNARPCASGLALVWASLPCPGATGSGPGVRAAGEVAGDGEAAGAAGPLVRAGATCLPAGCGVVPQAAIITAQAITAGTGRPVPLSSRILIGRHRSREGAQTTGCSDNSWSLAVIVIAVRIPAAATRPAETNSASCRPDWNAE